MAQVFNIDSSELVEFTNKLEKMHKSALPSAVRNTLNGAAFRIKGSKNSSNAPTLEAQADKAFVRRNRGFFKASSSIQLAKGFNIDQMQSVVGFTDKRLKGYTQPVKNLEKQEHGGQIPGRSFVPLRTSRTGRSKKRKVKKKNQLSSINQVINARDIKGRSDAEKFIRAALMAGKGGYVLGTEDAEGHRYMMRIESIKRKGPDNVVNSTPLYGYEEGNKVSVDRTNFFKKATNQAAKDLEKLFRENAEYQIKKLK